MFKLPIAGQIPGMNYDIYQQHFAVHQDGLEPKYKFLRAGLKDLHFCWKKNHVCQVCREKLIFFVCQTDSRPIPVGKRMIHHDSWVHSSSH